MSETPAEQTSTEQTVVRPADDAITAPPAASIDHENAIGVTGTHLYDSVTSKIAVIDREEIKKRGDQSRN